MMSGFREFRLAVIVAAIGLIAVGGSAGDLHLLGPDRMPVRWNEWLADHGSSAVLVWASWAPGANESLRAAGELREVARRKELEFVIVAVQEEFDEAISILDGSGAPWLHDRHGTILKEYRLIKVPCLIVVDGQGGVQARLDAIPGALTAWESQ